MSETLDEAGLLAAELLARRWLPRKHPRVRRALVDADLWQALQDRLAQVGLRLVDNIHADHISVALVRFDALVVITAGPGAIAFGCVVIVTMVASHQFDPRLIWDPIESNGEPHV